VDGKFRAADAFVAEDSKDAFFEADKARCRGFEIMSVRYSENFSRAVVFILCDTDFPMPMSAPVPVKRPLPSQWKTVDGQWFWYTDPVSGQGRVTPFGIMKAQPAGQPAAPAAPPPVRMDLATLSTMVKADKQAVSFDPAVAGVERVVVTSQMPGSVSLALEYARLEGLELKLDRTSLGQGGSAVLAISYRPLQGRQPSTTPVNIVVSPLDQVIPLQIVFRAPAR
jgi:hypothetical protein